MAWRFASACVIVGKRPVPLQVGHGRSVPSDGLGDFGEGFRSIKCAVGIGLLLAIMLSRLALIIPF